MSFIPLHQPLPLPLVSWNRVLRGRGETIPLRNGTPTLYPYMSSYVCIFVRRGSHVAAVSDLCWDNSHTPLLELWSRKFLVWRAIWTFPLRLHYTYTSNQKRIETPLPLHVKRSGRVGVRCRNGIRPKCQLESDVSKSGVQSIKFV